MLDPLSGEGKNLCTYFVRKIKRSMLLNGINYTTHKYCDKRERDHASTLCKTSYKHVNYNMSSTSFQIRTVLNNNRRATLDIHFSYEFNFENKRNYEYH